MLSIEYRLTGTGWSQCVILTKGNSVTISASYLSDALGDLARAVCAISNGDAQARCSFDEEPGEYRWLFERTGEYVSIRILWFGELWGEAPDEQGTEVIRLQIAVKELVLAIVKALGAVLAQHGIEGYREKWVGHDFPSQEYDKLKHSVNGQR